MDTGRHVRLSTSGLRGTPCVSRWQQFMETVYYPLDSTPTDPNLFRGEVVAVTNTTMTISRYAVDALRSSRRPGTDEEENFILFLPVRQRQHFSQRGVDRVAWPGELVALNASEPYYTEMADKSDCIALKIPSVHVRTRVPAIYDAHVGQTAANRAIVPVIRDLAAETLRISSSLDDGLIDRLGAQILDLVSLAFAIFDRPTTGTPESHVEARSHLIDRFIASNFRDPNLSVAQAANAAGISVRYVHRLLQLRGTSFGHELLLRRLDEGHRLLRGLHRTDQAPGTIADVAYACGFSSQSHFASRFRQRYGYTPREARSDGRPGH